MLAGQYRTRASWRIAMAAMLALYVACGDSEPGDGGDSSVPGLDDGAPRGLAASRMVTGAEDVTISLKTGAALSLPRGAVAQPVVVGVRRPKDSDAVNLLGGIAKQRVASAPYIVTPHGTQFLLDVTMTLPVSNVAAGKKLQVAWLENEQDTNWKVLGPATVANARVSFPLRHLSVFVLLEEESTSVVTDGGVEAGQADASSDASGTALLDASPSFERDAASNPGGTDASSVGDHQARLLTRFQECQLVARPGEFNLEDFSTDLSDRCYVECMINASCGELATQWCEGEGDSDGLLQCWSDCMGFRTITCDRYTADGSPDVGIATVCDGQDDCKRGEDEVDCPAGTHFICDNGEAIRGASRCDGYRNCSDDSDEEGCPVNDTLFQCGDGEQRAKASVCDGYDDCDNGADEVGCAGKLFNCEDGAFSVPLIAVCNGFANCEDGSDEPARCLQLLCAS